MVSFTAETITLAQPVIVLSRKLDSSFAVSPSPCSPSSRLISCCGVDFLRCLSTALPSCRWTPVARKQLSILLDVNACVHAAQNNHKKSLLCTSTKPWLQWDRLLSSSVYALERGLNMPTSSGWSWWDEWGGRVARRILLESQNSRKLGVWWLPWPSRISNR